MRGTLVFPADDRDFMQQLEMRGNNGGVETVETVYVVTGSTYYVPERLWAFDDPDLYRTAEPNRVNANDSSMAQTIYQFYADQPGPRMILRVHTHPGGPALPSEQDFSVANHRYQTFDPYFEDYEFFLGIHAIEDKSTPDSEWMRVPRQTGENKISWWGENRKHTIAVYDGSYEPRPVMVTTAAELQEQQRPQTGAGLEPAIGGEIWDA